MSAAAALSSYAIVKYTYEIFRAWKARDHAAGRAEKQKTKDNTASPGVHTPARSTLTPAARLEELNAELRELQIKRRGGVYVPPAPARPLPRDLTRIIMDFTHDDVRRIELAEYLEDWLAEHEANGGDLASLGPTDVELVIEALFFQSFKRG